jgi:hypothetical protein
VAHHDAPVGGVHGREAELAAVDAFLDALRAEAATVVVSGESGTGVTTLWAAGVARARERGLLVVRARPTAAESGLPHGVLADLLPSLLPTTGTDDVLPPPQRRAVDAVLLRGPPNRSTATGPPRRPDPRGARRGHGRTG